MQHNWNSIQCLTKLIHMLCVLGYGTYMPSFRRIHRYLCIITSKGLNGIFQVQKSVVKNCIKRQGKNISDFFLPYTRETGSKNICINFKKDPSTFIHRKVVGTESWEKWYSLMFKARFVHIQSPIKKWWIEFCYAVSCIVLSSTESIL